MLTFVHNTNANDYHGNNDNDNDDDDMMSGIEDLCYKQERRHKPDVHLTNPAYRMKYVLVCLCENIATMVT